MKFMSEIKKLIANTEVLKRNIESRYFISCIKLDILVPKVGYFCRSKRVRRFRGSKTRCWCASESQIQVLSLLALLVQKYKY